MNVESFFEGIRGSVANLMTKELQHLDCLNLIQGRGQR